jgi:asparagine synthase (glutamine-hydrolysing)
MSAIGGVHNFEGAPVDEGLLLNLGNRLDVRGPDGGREILFNSVGMAYRAFHTNSESRMEAQPLVSPDGHLLAWDGRLDNREELISMLRHDLRGKHTDVAIVMTAYLKWGLDFLARVIGDFALSLWDPYTRMLLLARDPVGTRNLYYHANDVRIIWSSELSSLLDLTEIKLEINEEYIAEFLTRLPEPSQTPYKNIHAVPPAKAVIEQNGQLKVQRFWALNPNYEIRYKTDDDYEEHFRQVFREAVRRRLRVDGPVWAELSGGLDSSSIVCMADQINKIEGAPACKLETVSLVYDEASKSDERKYIQEIEKSIGRPGLHLREDDYRILAPSINDREIIPNPTNIFSEYYRGLSNAMRDKGARVLLSGKGGDEILSSAPNPTPELTDLLIQWRLWLFLRRVGEWGRALNKSYSWLLWHKAAIPILPRTLQHVFLSRKSRKSFELYNDEFVKRFALKARKRTPPQAFGFRYPSARDQYRSFLSIVRELSAGYWAGWGIEISYPLVDRTLVEFMQAIPHEQRVRPGETRSLLRRALRSVVPTAVLSRRGKTLNTQASFLAVARESSRLSELLSDALVCKYGYINPEPLLMALERASSGSDLSSLSITFIICLEIWLRGLEQTLYRKEAAAISPRSILNTRNLGTENGYRLEPKVTA